MYSVWPQFRKETAISIQIDSFGWISGLSFFSPRFCILGLGFRLGDSGFGFEHFYTEDALFASQKNSNQVFWFHVWCLVF